MNAKPRVEFEDVPFEKRLTLGVMNSHLRKQRIPASIQRPIDMKNVYFVQAMTGLENKPLENIAVVVKILDYMSTDSATRTLRGTLNAVERAFGPTSDAYTNAEVRGQQCVVESYARSF